MPENPEQKLPESEKEILQLLSEKTPEELAERYSPEALEEMKETLKSASYHYDQPRMTWHVKKSEGIERIKSVISLKENQKKTQLEIAKVRGFYQGMILGRSGGGRFF